MMKDIDGRLHPAVDGQSLDETRRSPESISLTLNLLYHTTPRKLCRCEVRDVHSLQSFVSTHSEENESLLFNLLFAITYAFNISSFETEFNHFFREVVCLFVCLFVA